MMRLLGVVFSVTLLLVANEAQAAKLIAVLPLDVSNTEGKLSKAAKASLEEMLRDVATTALAPADWTVLTGETTIQVLRDNGVKVEECGNQSCHLEMAREIKAEKFLSGNVQYVEGQYIASIRLIDTGSGRILASERATGKSVTTLRESFEARADAFFVRGGMLGGSTAPLPRETTTVPPVVDGARPQVKKSKVTEAVGSLTVTARPKEAVRLELVDPQGKALVSGVPYENKTAAPGRWKVVAKAAGYEEEEQSIEVPPDDVTVVKFELKRLGALSVTGEPAGAAVAVNGPGDFKDEGGLPWEASGLKSGTYDVKVSRKGYADTNETVIVEPGKTATVKVALQKGSGESGKPVVPGSAPVRGDPMAKVTIVEYADFQCPYCSRATKTIDAVLKKYKGKVKLEFKHQPLPFHAQAKPAAKAAMAAGEQGKFWEMHDRMFANQKDLAPEKYEEWATELDLNMAKFKEAVASTKYDSIIDADSQAGTRVGASGTPTFFINGRKLTGAQPQEQFEAIIEEELKKKGAGEPVT